MEPFPFLVSTFLEDELPLVISCIGAHILLQVRVLVVVHPQALVAQNLSNILDQTSLTR